MRYIIAAALLISASAAYAQQAPSQDEMLAASNIEAGQLRLWLGQSQQQVLELKKQLNAMQAELAKLKPAEEKKSP